MSLPTPPYKRKSPIFHKVRTHTKKTPKTHRVIRIDEYHRGHGSRKTVRKVGSGKPHLTLNLERAGGDSYLGSASKSEATWRFSIQSGESLKFNAQSVQDALSIGLSKIRGTPRVIRMRRLS